MDDSLDFLKDDATPRTLLRRFMAVADVEETPLPFKTRGAAAKNASSQETESGTRKRRSTRMSKGEQSMSREVLRQQAKQSSSFMDQTLNASVIQGANQTYANIVPQDSDSSASLVTSFDMEKAAKWQKKKKKKKLEDASVLPEKVPKPPAKKKIKRKSLSSTNTTKEETLSEKWRSGKEASDTTAKEVQPDEPQNQNTKSSAEANTAANESQASLPSIESSMAGGDKITSDISADISDVSYSFISEKDDSHLNIEKAKVRFGTQVKSRKLNLPSIIELLPPKQKSTDPQTATSAEDAVDAPDLQVTTPVESPAASPKAAQESSKSQDVSTDFIPPPVSFRDEDTFTDDILREANFSAHGKGISITYNHQEPAPSQGLPNVQEEDSPVGQENATSEVTTTPTPTKLAKRKSVADVSATTTPTRSSQRKSVAEVTATTTPTKSSQRKSVADVSATTTPTKSSQRKSVADVSATTTLTKSSQRKSVAEVTATITPTRSAKRKSLVEVTATTTSTRSEKRKSVAEVTAITTPTRSSQRKSVADVTATTTPTRSARKSVGVLVSPRTDKAAKEDTSTARSVRETTMSQVSDDEGTSGGSPHPQGKEGSHDAQGIGELAQHASGDNKEGEFEDEGPNKKRRISGSLSKGGAQDVLAMDAIEEAPLSDSEEEDALNLEPLQLSFHGNDESATTPSPVDTASSVDALKVKTTTTTPMPKAQPSAPFTTAKVRQMTMKEFLEQLKSKPVPPPVPKPKPLLPGLLAAPSPSKTSAKPPQKKKSKRGTKKPELPAALPRSVTKELFTHFCKCRVTEAAVNEVVQSSEIFWSNLTRDIFNITSENSDQIESSDVEKVMKRVKMITPEQSLKSLVEELLPLEMWSMFMPFPDVAKNPFSPIVGELPKLQYQRGDTDDETAG